MKIDPQHLLPAHVPFYKGRLFWGVVLLGVFVASDTYIIIQNGFSLETLLFPAIVLPALIFGGITSSEIVGVFLSLVLYSVLLYFSFSKKEINLYSTITLIALIILSVISLSNFTGS